VISICEIQIYSQVAVYNIKLIHLDCISHLNAEDDIGIVKEPELKVIEAICYGIAIHKPALVRKGRAHRL
jgi:hypothetical protein